MRVDGHRTAYTIASARAAHAQRARRASGCAGGVAVLRLTAEAKSRGRPRNIAAANASEGRRSLRQTHAATSRQAA